MAGRQELLWAVAALVLKSADSLGEPAKELGGGGGCGEEEEEEEGAFFPTLL